MSRVDYRTQLIAILVLAVALRLIRNSSARPEISRRRWLSASRATFVGNGIARHAVLDAALSGLAHGFEREAIDGWLDDGRRMQALRMRTHGGVSSPPLMKFT
jgi:hypothetical protein